MNRLSQLANDDNAKQFRNCLGIAIIDRKKQILVFQRIDNPGSFWQIPQGGLEDGEEEIEGAYREVYEEIGISKDNLMLLDTPSKYFYYNIPKEQQKNLWQGRFVGQRIKWFVFSIKTIPKTLNLTSHHKPEFLAWKWISIKDLQQVAVDFKKELYQKLKQLLMDSYHNYEI